MMVPAPGLLSTITGCPSACVMPVPSARAMASVPPPGANGTTSFTGLSGNAARTAEDAKAAIASTAQRRRTMDRNGMRMDVSPWPWITAPTRTKLRDRAPFWHPSNSMQWNSYTRPNPMAAPAPTTRLAAEKPGRSPANRSLERGIDILRSFRPGSELLGNAELAERTQLSRSTVSRLTQTLVGAASLQVEPQSRAYPLAPAVLSLAHAMRSGSTVLAIAAPHMRATAQAHGINVG